MKTKYTAPELTVVKFVVEYGFANSDKVYMMTQFEMNEDYNSYGQQNFEVEEGYFGGNGWN